MRCVAMAEILIRISLKNFACYCLLLFSSLWSPRAQIRDDCKMSYTNYKCLLVPAFSWHNIKLVWSCHYFKKNMKFDKLRVNWCDIFGNLVIIKISNFLINSRNFLQLKLNFKAENTPHVSLKIWNITQDKDMQSMIHVCSLKYQITWETNKISCFKGENMKKFQRIFYIFANHFSYFPCFTWQQKKSLQML